MHPWSSGAWFFCRGDEKLCGTSRFFKSGVLEPTCYKHGLWFLPTSVAGSNPIEDLHNSLLEVKITKCWGKSSVLLSTRCKNCLSAELSFRSSMTSNRHSMPDQRLQLCFCSNLPLRDLNCSWGHDLYVYNVGCPLIRNFSIYMWLKLKALKNKICIFLRWVHTKIWVWW